MTTDQTTSENGPGPTDQEADGDTGSASLGEALRPLVPVAVGLAVAVVIGQLVRQRVRDANRRSWSRHPVRRTAGMIGLRRLLRR